MRRTDVSALLCEFLKFGAKANSRTGIRIISNAAVVMALATSLGSSAARAQVTFTGAAGSGNFGSQAVGAPSAAKPLTFSVAAGTTVGSVEVVTQGAAGLDFASATGTNCAAKTYTSAAMCMVTVTFKPLVTGLRRGAVVFFSEPGNTGTVLASVPVYGIGTGPQVTFSSDSTAAIVLDSNLSFPDAVAVDARGNVFIGDDGNHDIVELPAGGGAPIVISVAGTPESPFQPFALAVDGAGNLFIADGGTRVVEVPVGSGPAVAFSPVVDGLATAPSGMAVDGAGDLFISDSANARIVEVPAGGGPATAITPMVDGVPLSFPEGLAVDGAGDLFIADPHNHRVVKVPPGGGTPAAISPPGLMQPSAVAVDGAGDLFIADDIYGVKEVEAGTGAVISTNLSAFLATAVALDGAGDLLIDDFNGRVIKVPRSAPLSFNLSSQKLNTTSFGQLVTLTNSGNSTLTFDGQLTGANATEFSKWSTCDGTLAAGSSCTFHLFFTPTFEGAATADLTITDNASGSPHSLVLTGTGTTASPAVTLSASSIAFGNHALNRNTETESVTLTNSGGSNLEFSTELTGTNASEFSKWSTCTGTLAPAASCILHVFFTPTVAGPASAALTITDNASGSPQSITLSGTGTP